MAGRRERPLDPMAGPVEAFACDLRELRAAAGGPTYREMARRAGYSASALAAAAAGDQLPSLPVTLAYAEVCAGDSDEWESRWRAASRAAEEQTVLVADDDAAEAPYRGLARFEPDDRGLFFGRDELVAELLHLLSAHRFVMLTGASGSGKSSLLRAGLIPRLRTGRGAAGVQCTGIKILTPGAQPFATHARTVSRRADGDTLVVVDQFEEVFTLCRDPAERARFIHLLSTARDPARGLRVVVAVRADFYGHCTEHAPLVEALRTAHLLVGPMAPADLRQAIVGPARAAGLIVERELTARIVEQAAGEPGALPLMSHALLEVWRRRRGRTLTLAAYEAIGGVHGAIADTAEHTYSSLSADESVHARRMLLRLITPGQGAQDTRRPAPRTELAAVESQEATTVLERLAHARLVTLDGDTADLAHEALITAWPRLRTWIDEERVRLVTHRRLTADADAWAELDRDASALYRGTRLATAREAFPDPYQGLTAVERDFLAASVTAEEDEDDARARTTSRLRRSTAALAVLLVLAVLAGTVALRQSHTSNEQRDKALTAQRTALSHQLAARSDEQLIGNPALASLLALHAYRASPTREARASLLRAADIPLRTTHRIPVGLVLKASFSPDLRTVAYVDGESRALLHDLKLKRSVPVGASAEDAVDVAFNPDGGSVAIAYLNGAVRIHDAKSGRLRTTLDEGQGPVTVLTFSRDGRQLATTSADATIRVWDVGTGHTQHVFNTYKKRNPPPSEQFQALDFSPDGRTLVSGGRDVLLWDLMTGRSRVYIPKPQFPYPVPEEKYYARAVFGFDGSELAVAQHDGMVTLRDSRNSGGIIASLSGHVSLVKRLVFSRDGATLVTADDDTLRIWDARSQGPRVTLTGYTRGVNAIAFSADNRSMVTMTQDGTVREWETGDLNTHTLKGHTSAVSALSFSADGRTLVTAGHDATVRTWGLPEGRRAVTLTGIRRVVALSPDGRTLVTADRDGTVRLRDAGTGALRRTLPGTAPGVNSLVFTSDGSTLAALANNRIHLWDVDQGRRHRILTGPVDGAIETMTPHPSGSALVTRGSKGTLRIWDVRTGEVLRTLPLPGYEHSPTFTPDGRTLATIDYTSTNREPDSPRVNYLRLRDPETGALRRTLTLNTHAVIESMAFHPDGKTLATGGKDGTARIWDVETGAVRRTFSDVSFVNHVAFSPDRTTLATTSFSGVVRLWSVDLPDETDAVQQICRSVNRELTAAERRQYNVGEASVCPEAGKGTSVGQ
ncbi:nSTAND1 domain-containing NTPase [Streptomyces sp. NPDC003860]